MKPYGLHVILFPDVADIQKMAAKSSTGRFPEKGGDFKSYSRNPNKNKIRRTWKKKARQTGKKETNDAVSD